MELLAHIRDTLATTRNALADGKLTADEIKAITREVLSLALALLGEDKADKPAA